MFGSVKPLLGIKGNFVMVLTHDWGFENFLKIL